MIAARTTASRLLFAGSLVLAASGSWAGAQAQDYRLTILHTNDVHARLEPNNRGGGSCSAKDIETKGCFGGAARIAGQIAQWRGQAPNVLVLDAGDEFQGTLFYNVHKARAAAEVMNLIGYDAMTPGNHEFDDKPVELANLIKRVHFPVVSANIVTSKEPLLQGMMAPYLIVERGGQQIGIIGVTTETTPISSSPGPTVSFENEIVAVRRQVAVLKGLGINKIVVLSHAGIGRDREIARAVNDVDVIVGGHTHTLLSNTAKDAEGPYPLVEKSPAGKPVAIVQSWEHGRMIGRIDLVFDRAGTLKSWSGDTKLLDDSVPSDATVEAKVKELNEPIKALRAKQVAQISTELTGPGTTCRVAECNLGSMLADALLWKTRDAGTQIAIQNGGGVRAAIPAGQVTLGQVLEVLPFSNTVATMSLKGSDLLAAFEHAVSQATDPQANNTGRFLQLAGARLTWDAAKPAGSRLVKGEVRQADGSYQPIDPDRTYKIVTNNFTRNGGDGYAMFKTKAIDPYDYGPNMEDAFAEYLATNPSIPKVGERVVRLN